MGRLKYVALCLAALCVPAAVGSVYAAETADIAEAENEEKTAPRAKETAEKITIDAALVKKYLKKTGSADGYDVYLAEKDFDDALWEKNGGKPKKKADYTPEQEQLDDDINEPVTFIKMDIEGFELDALMGSKHHIIMEKPKLAICVYHKPDDLWQIPEYILQLNPSYKLYLRQYKAGDGNNAWESVLYAV